MESKKIEATNRTPEVYLGPEGSIKIRGRSISEDAKGFYDEINQWLDDYLKNATQITSVDITLEYFNSASAKQIIMMLQRLLELTQENKKLIVNWYYEEGDEDILEKGEYFSSILELKFNFVELS